MHSLVAIFLIFSRLWFDGKFVVELPPRLLLLSVVVVRVGCGCGSLYVVLTGGGAVPAAEFTSGDDN